MADELSATRQPMAPAEFNAIIYRNLGVEYHSIITALTLRLTPVSFNELHGHLLAHEVLLNGVHDSPSANLTYQPPLLPIPSVAYSTPRPQ